MSASGGPYPGRRSGRPWLAWLIILLIAGFIIWLIVAYAAGSRSARRSAYPVPAPVTDLAAIVEARDRPALAGRIVSLSNVMVRDVIDNQGFWVERNGQQLFVRSVNPQQVRRGETVDVIGTLQKSPKDPQTAWNIRPTTSQMISQEGVYLLASKVTGH